MHKNCVFYKKDVFTILGLKFFPVLQEETRLATKDCCVFKKDLKLCPEDKRQD